MLKNQEKVPRIKKVEKHCSTASIKFEDKNFNICLKINWPKTLNVFSVFI